MLDKVKEINKTQKNVYDLIADFYNPDEEWNIYLRQNYAEGFIRFKAFQGASEAELCRIWNNIIILCAYASNVDIYLGDLSADDFIDCVAWCGRNVSEFVLTAEKVAYFLDVCDDLIKYLQSRNVIFNESEVALAKTKLLKDGQLQMLNQDGTFKPGYEQYALNANPDLPVKIFVNLNEHLNNLVEDMRQFFSQDKFAEDRQRASLLFYGNPAEVKKEEVPREAEEEQFFWDYFFFDYRMLANDETPLYNYRAYYQKQHPETTEQANSCGDLLNTMLQARLVFFSMAGFDEQTGLYHCRDFFSKEYFELNLPTEVDFEVDSIIFLGHMLPDGTMVTNYLRCLKMGALAQKRLWELLSHLKSWYTVQCPKAADWQVFVYRNAIMVLRLAMYYSTFYMMGTFTHETRIKDYVPRAAAEDHPVLLAAWRLLGTVNFPYRDQKLLIQLWSDFLAGGTFIPADGVITWAIALIYVFIKLNKTYKISPVKYGKRANISEEEILEKVSCIELTLGIEPFDPRYIDEDGMLMLAMS